MFTGEYYSGLLRGVWAIADMGAVSRVYIKELGVYGRMGALRPHERRGIPASGNSRNERRSPCIPSMQLFVFLAHTLVFGPLVINQRFGGC